MTTVDTKKKVQTADTFATADPTAGLRQGADLTPTSDTGARLRVAKAYKMYVGGAFIRSESGRYFQTRSGASADPESVNIPLGSRKDIRDAVLIAKNAQNGWAARTAYNRGQILYRLAEVLEARSPELVASLVRGGSTEADAEREVELSVDRSVYYAGLCDKISSLLASHNPVSGPHFGFTVPESMGVVGVIPPSSPVLLGLVSTILPIIASGNTVIAIASSTDPRTAIVFAECVATSDVPGGVINIVTGVVKELVPHLAKHREVNGIEGHFEDVVLAGEVERFGADSVKRVKAHTQPIAWQDERKGQGLSFVERFIEHKSIWHPMGI